jgi:hypothetical protein
MGRPRRIEQVITHNHAQDMADAVDGAQVKAVLREKTFDQMSEAKIPYEIIESLSEFSGIELYHKNYLIHEFKELSTESTDWYVSLYYPNAQGKTVYIDFPQSPRQLALCERKAEIMKAQKKRYIVYRPGETAKTPEEMGLA